MSTSVYDNRRQNDPSGSSKYQTKSRQNKAVANGSGQLRKKENNNRSGHPGGGILLIEDDDQPERVYASEAVPRMFTRRKKDEDDDSAYHDDEHPQTLEQQLRSSPSSSDDDGDDEFYDDGDDEYQEVIEEADPDDEGEPFLSKTQKSQRQEGSSFTPLGEKDLDRIAWHKTTYNLALEGKPDALQNRSDHHGQVKLGLGSGVTVTQTTKHVSDGMTAGPKKDKPNDEHIVRNVVVAGAHNPYPFDLEFYVKNVVVPDTFHPHSQMVHVTPSKAGKGKSARGLSFVLNGGETVAPGQGRELVSTSLNPKEVTFHSFYPEFHQGNLELGTTRDDTEGVIKIKHDDKNPHPIVDFTAHLTKKDQTTYGSMVRPSKDSQGYFLMKKNDFDTVSDSLSDRMGKSPLAKSSLGTPEVFVKAVNLAGNHPVQSDKQRRPTGNVSGAPKKPSSSSSAGIRTMDSATESDTSNGKTAWTTLDNKYTDGENKFGKAWVRLQIESVPIKALKTVGAKN